MALKGKRGPDGWRSGVVRWAKGDHASRKLHYFENGSALCGNHHDGVQGWYTQVRTEFDTYQEGFKCKKCVNKLEKREKLVNG
jgi:hypothetical protein